MGLPNQHARPYGVGIAYRHVLQRDVMRFRDRIDLIEVPTIDYIVRQRRVCGDPNERLLKEALQVFPGVAHGINLSIGTVEVPAEDYLSGTERLLQEHNLVHFSEHTAFHDVDGNDLHIFLPLPFGEESIRWLKQKYYAVRNRLQRPFALENVSYYFPIPGCALDEADFFRRIAEETDCSFLLDVTNVFNNSHNHQYDPLEYFDRFPMDRVTQMHLAGGLLSADGRWEDSHSEPVMDEVWPLFDEALKRTSCEIVIVERDTKFSPFETIQHDIDRARECFFKHRPQQPPPRSQVDGVIAEAADGKLDPHAPEHATLRGFQRCMMRWITNEKFRDDWERDAASAAASLGLQDPAWIQRLQECDRSLMHYLVGSWGEIQKENETYQKGYEQREWTAWAQYLQGTN